MRIGPLDCVTLLLISLGVGQPEANCAPFKSPTEHAARLRGLVERPLRERALASDQAEIYAQWVRKGNYPDGFALELGTLCLAWARDKDSETTLKARVASFEEGMREMAKQQAWKAMPTMSVSEAVVFYALAVRVALRKDDDGYFREISDAMRRTEDVTVRMMLANRLWVDFGDRAEAEIFEMFQKVLGEEPKGNRDERSAVAQELLYYLSKTRDSAMAMKVLECLRAHDVREYAPGNVHEILNVMVVSTPGRNWGDGENNGLFVRALFEGRLGYGPRVGPQHILKRQ